MSTTSLRHRTLALGAAFSIVAAVGVARIVATYHVFNQTYDEPAHLAAGMEWLIHGTYTYERLHPPLARIAIASGPYLDGARSHNNASIWREGNAILYDHGRYWRTLALARSGVLPFFVAGLGVVFIWGCLVDYRGRATGLWAAAALSLTPPVLAHAGVATTDMASAATIAGALLAFGYWLDGPTPGRSILLGIGTGLAMSSKMSALVYLPAAGAAIISVYFLWRSDRARASVVERVAGIVTAAVVAVALVAAVYRFALGPLIAPRPPRAGTSVAARVGEWIAQRPMFPAPAYARGLMELRAINRTGRKNYVWGEPAIDGRWYFFPFALAVKTPLPFLLLAGLGGSVLIANAARHRRWYLAAPPTAALAILAAAAESNINIGVRHVLPIYLPLAVCVGAGLVALWYVERHRAVGRTTATMLMSWLVIASARAHPDYLAYFNELAGAHPERMLVDSDLDWGQDLARLVDTLHARHIDRFSIIYHGSADLAQHDLPPFTVLQPRVPTTGWVAASVYRVKLGYVGGSTFDDFGWLRAYTPVARIGHSIWLYWIPPSASLASASSELPVSR